MIGRQYFARQAKTLLEFANSTTNAKLAAVLVEKAADLKFQVDETIPPPDKSPRAPDVEPPNYPHRARAAPSGQTPLAELAA